MDLLVGHYYFMSWSYFGLLAAFLSQIGTRLGPMPGGVSAFAAVGIATFLMAGVASVLINRNAKPVTARYGAKL